jgi:hypothetical protein
VVDSEDNLVWAVVSEFSPVQIGYAPLIDSDRDGIDDSTDINPLLDIQIQINIQDIKALDLQHYLELDSFYSPSTPVAPDFYCVISVDAQSAIISDVFEWDNYHVLPNWKTVWNVPDDQPLVDISISLWDKNLPSNTIPIFFFDPSSFAGQQPPYTIPSVICDISRDLLGGIGAIWSDPPYQSSYSDVELTYDLIAQKLVINDETDDDGYEYNPDDGNWYPDANGVGRVSGAEDECQSINYQYENDCELFFDVTQNDENDCDMDGVENSFDSNPFVNLELTVEIKEIMGLMPDWKNMDTPLWQKGPEFYCAIKVADLPIIESPIFGIDQSVVYPDWTLSVDIPDDLRFIPIRIALFDDDSLEGGYFDLCDISVDPGTSLGDWTSAGFDGGSDIELTYDVALGQLVQYNGYEDDWVGDSNGVNHVSGEEDGSVPSVGQIPPWWDFENDCELWFDVSANDNDDDNATYWYEINVMGTDPFNPDCDADGLLDGDELKYVSLDTDSDGDGLTNIWDSDSDNDGLLDGYEDKTYYEWDWCKYVYLFDHIYMWNLHEYINVDLDIYAQSLQEWRDNPRLVPHHTSPIDPDSDDDGLSDGQEVNTYYAHQEVNWPHYTCPLDPDTEADGATDGEEIEKGTCPVLWDQPYAWVGLAPVSSPDDYSLTLWEEDISVSFHWSYLFIQSGCSDPTFYLELDGTRFFTAYSSFCYYGSKIAWDVVEGYHTIDIHYSIDWDGTNNIYIYASKTKTFLYLTAAGDADGDGIPNYWETTHGLNPFNYADGSEDADRDGLVNYLEYQYGTDINNPYSDGDTLMDGAEVITYKTNPLLADTDGDGTRDDLDVDPLVNLQIQVTIKEILQLDGLDWAGSAGDFYCWIHLLSGGNLYQQNSPEPLSYGGNNPHIITPWIVPIIDVPDNDYWVVIQIWLWDDDSNEWFEGDDDLCDISKEPGIQFAQVYWDMRIGMECNEAPYADDFPGDPNGIGHVSGNEDGSKTTNEADCELWFDIAQTDYEGTQWGDGLTYWEEINRYHTSPKIYNDDNDQIPAEFEKKYDYNGIPWDNIGMNPLKTDTDDNGVSDKDEDQDQDGLTNYEEMLVGSSQPNPGTDPNLFGLNLVVSLNWDVGSAYYDLLVIGLKYASDILFDVTDGYLCINAVSIYDTASATAPEDIDILIWEGTATSSSGTSGTPPWPHTTLDDDRINMPQYLNKGGWSDPDDGQWYRAIVHELMHLIIPPVPYLSGNQFFLYDEYLHSDGTHGSYCDGCIMDDEFNDALCTPSNHNQDTKQEAERGESCWQTFLSYYSVLLWFDLDNNGVRDTTVDADGNGIFDILENYLAISGPTTWGIPGPYTKIINNTG